MLGLSVAYKWARSVSASKVLSWAENEEDMLRKNEFEFWIDV